MQALFHQLFFFVLDMSIFLVLDVYCFHFHVLHLSAQYSGLATTSYVMSLHTSLITAVS